MRLYSTSVWHSLLGFYVRPMLLYGELTIRDADLVVPHPRMAQRAFVLIPLTELAPDLRDPASHRLYRDMLNELPDQGVYSHQTPPL